MSSYNRLFYHFIWGTKNREPIILPEFEAELYSLIAAKAIELGGIVHAVGGMDEHVHLCVTIPPKIAVARFIGEAKGNSSHAINHVVKPHYNFYWQNEYGVLSFAEKNLAGIVQYIHNQKEHHAKGTINQAMETVAEEE
jgi:REP element-mobilizing transposase RayT